jgi:hypothetical protein
MFPHVGEQPAERVNEVGVKAVVQGTGACHLLQEMFGVVGDDGRCGR